jgi:hypothetical protein
MVKTSNTYWCRMERLLLQPPNTFREEWKDSSAENYYSSHYGACICRCH